MTAEAPRRGELWLADLNPVRGHEQSGRRPVLVLSEDTYNAGPADLVVALAVTTTLRRLRTQVAIAPDESGLPLPSAVMCDQIRTISKGRLTRRLGAVAAAKLDEIEDAVRILLGL